MPATNRTKAWAHLARLLALGAGVMVLAGCMADYAYVQPNTAGSGGYYTSDEPYSGQGYYDYYGTGPYFPGTSGWGYYNGTPPYSSAFGWFGGDYGDFGYWSSFTFNLGISNVWGFPGYWGPWYSLNIPLQGCRRRDCRHHHHRRDHHSDGRHDALARDTSPRSWLKPDRPRVRRLAHGSRPLIEEQAHSVERLASPRPLESASFAPHDFARAPIRLPNRERFIGTPASRSYTPRAPATESVFANRRAMPMPTSRAVPQQASMRPHSTFRSAPRSAPVSRPHRDDAKAKIP